MTKEAFKWEHVKHQQAKSAWDQWLINFEHHSVFQCYAWAEYKDHAGWDVDRWAVLMDGSAIVMAQTLSKSIPGGARLVWVPGGPSIEHASLSKGKADSVLKEFVNEMVGFWGGRLYLRINMTPPTSAQMSYHLNKTFQRALYPINSGYSYQVEIKHEVDDQMSGLSRKHRYYTRKSLAADIDWYEGNTLKNLRDFVQVHHQMTMSKRLKRLSLVEDDLDLLLRCFSDQCIILTGHIQDVPVTSCLILTLGKSAFYYLAATNAQGREVSAAYGMVMQAMDALSRRGITNLDMGGIDPRGEPGVIHFKKGFGGEVIEYLGEWDWASSEWLRWIANFLIGRKMRGI